MEISLSKARENKDFRIDAEFFEILPPENPTFRWVDIGDVLEDAQYGISINMNEEGVGYPIYRMNEIESMLCVEDVAKCAAVESQEGAPFFLRDGDVLFNRTNSQELVGRTGLFKPYSADPRIFASYLIRLRVRPGTVLPEYLVAFLNANRGVRDVKRRARISINQSNVNGEEVKAVRMPLAGMKLQERVKTSFDRAHKLLVDSKQCWIKAENVLIEALGLTDWRAPVSVACSRRSSEVFGNKRMDAEYYQEKYRDLALRLQALPCEVVTVGDVCPEPVNGAEIREYQEEGTPYLRVGDLTQLDVDLSSVVRVATSEANGTVLDTRAITASFNGGVYLVWNVTGRVRFRITSNAGYNAVVSGLFFH